MKYCLTALLVLCLTASCNRNNDDRPVCTLSGAVYYGYYGFMFPNAFTPNGDGKNDRFRPMLSSSSSQISAFSLRIVDKEGNTVFETADPLTTGWDGRSVAGVAMPPNRYVANVSYRNSYGESYSNSICVTLLSYGGGQCIPRSYDGEYLFEDMFDPMYGSFNRHTLETVCN